MDDTAHGPPKTGNKVADPEQEGWVKGDDLHPSTTPVLEPEVQDSTYRVGQGDIVGGSGFYTRRVDRRNLLSVWPCLHYVVHYDCLATEAKTLASRQCFTAQMPD